MRINGQSLLKILSPIVFYASMYYLFNSHLAAVIVTLSVIAHELGHASVLWSLKQPVSFQFIAFAGAAVIPKNSKAVAELPRNIQVLMVAAGPAVNIVILCAAAIVGAFIRTPYIQKVVEITIYVNMFFAVLNLVPVFILDGGKLWYHVVKSLNLQGFQLERFILLGPTLGVLVLLFAQQKWVLGLLVSLIHLPFFLAKEKPSEEDEIEAQPLSKRAIAQTFLIHVIVWTVLWIALAQIPRPVEFLP